MYTTATPAAVSSRMTRNSTLTSVIDSAEVGSSMISTRAFCRSARAISTSCCCPMRRSPTRVSGSSCSSSRSSTATVGGALGLPVQSPEPVRVLPAEEQVVLDGQVGAQAELLVDDDDAPVRGLPRRAEQPPHHRARRGRSACSMPERIFISVDLPAPFSPNSAVTRPSRTVRVTPSSACVPP